MKDEGICREGADGQPDVLRAINPRHNPTLDMLNRIRWPFKLRLTLVPIERQKDGVRPDWWRPPRYTERCFRGAVRAAPALLDAARDVDSSVPVQGQQSTMRLSRRIDPVIDGAVKMCGGTDKVRAQTGAQFAFWLDRDSRKC